MHAFQQETTQILNTLEEAYTRIQTVIRPEIEHFRNRILQGLKKEIDILRIQSGLDAIAPPESIIPIERIPLKKVMGKDVTVTTRPKDVNLPYKQTPEDVEYFELQTRADELYPKILATPSDNLLDSVTEQEMRALAKKAGLPVTNDNPKRITIEYIDKIKAAIREKNSRVNPPPSIETTSINKQETYGEFSKTDNKTIFEIYSEEEIKEFGRLAGLPMSPKMPLRIDNKVLNDIKAAIRKHNKLNEKAGV